MIGILAVLVLSLSPWFALSIEGGRPGCVAVQWVQPDGPSGRAGLKEGDCISRVNGQAVSTSDALLQALGKVPTKEVTALTLSSGRVVRVLPGTRSREAEIAYCEFRRSKLARVRVFIFMVKTKMRM
jgi:S1-C subfamily serine protease